MQDEKYVLNPAARWVYLYNVLRPHLGKGMEKRTPLQMLRHLGHNGRDHIALFPPVLLNKISTDLLLACDPESGNDLLTYYTVNSFEGLRHGNIGWEKCGVIQ